VFFLGGLPAADDAEATLRRNLITLQSSDVDRPAGATTIQGMLLIAKQQDMRLEDGELGLADAPLAEGDRIGPFFNFNSIRLERTAADTGDGYKMLFAPLIIELDNATGYVDDLIGWDFIVVVDNPAVLGTGSPSIPYEGTHVLYQDIFIPTATDPYSFTRDPQSSGL
jgi:hypothetical protein